MEFNICIHNYGPFQDDCGPTFIWDICEWKNDDFADKFRLHKHI